MRALQVADRAMLDPAPCSISSLAPVGSIADTQGLTHAARRGY
jgi:hypothetical protein